jgi:hypothetical protein
MAPEPWVARHTRALLFAILTLFASAPAAHAARIVSYNILNYPGSTGATRDPLFRTILSPLGADVVVVGEITSQAGVDEFLGSVLNTMEPGLWSAAPFVNGNDTDNAIFWKTSKFQFLGQWGFYPNAANLLRLVHVYRLKPAGYTSGATEIRIYAMHLKASTGFEAQRFAECTGLRDSMNAVPPGTHAIALGDFNFYAGDGTEPGFGKMLESQADNDGRLYDPLGLQGLDWQDNTTIQYAWTQSPCATGDTGCASGASTGGMDDRFDLILPTYNWNDGEGLDLIPNTYVAVGNDGQHHNNGINAPPTIPEGSTYANALHAAADHLPVRIDIMLPARQTVSGGPFAFGTVITGATATTNLTVGNPATPPADTLEYTLSATAGFTAPAGSFTRLAGPGSDSHTIGMDTSTPGGKTGTATVHSNSLDAPTFNVGLSGTVLRHASPSLDSASVVTASALDFGVHDPDGFTDGEARLHNQGYDALQAQLAVASASVVGGDGRFTIVGGTAPIQLAGIGETYTIHFDDAGATRDSLYEATLVIQSADQALPGGVAHADLQVSLTAQLTPGSTTGIGAGDVPTITRLQAPFPNPLRGTSTVHFDLARAADVRLEVFDLSGRRVATLASHAFAPGRWSATWNGRHDSGAPAGAGLYFVRLSGDGLPMQTARLAVVR